MEAKRDLSILQTIPVLIMVCLVGLPVQAKYSGGTGEPNDPYQIATAGYSPGFLLSMAGQDGCTIGVASGNSLVRLISGSVPNSLVQATILRNFATAGQIEDYFLDQMQARTCQASGCFPFIDAIGNAAILEVNRSAQVWGYDGLNLARQAQGLYGFVVRANEFHMRSDGTDNASIGGRYASGVYNALGLIAHGDRSHQHS
jgi:hypothetical protein